MKYRIIFLLSFWLPLLSFAQTKDDNDPRTYFVGLKNGQKLYANRVQIKSPLLKSNYFLLDDSLKLPMDAVKYYQNQDGFYLKIADPYGRDEFAKRVISGRISKYSVSKTYYDNMYPGYGYGGYGYGGFGRYGYPGGFGGPSRRNIYFFSKDDGELQNFSFNNIREALSDNPGSVAMLNKYRKGKLVDTGLSLAGAALIIYGITHSFTNQDVTGTGIARVSPTVYAGGALLAIPLVSGWFKKDKITEAIELYNYQQK